MSSGHSAQHFLLLTTPGSFEPTITSAQVFLHAWAGRPDFQCLLHQKVDLPPIKDRKHPLIVGDETSIVGGIRADQQS